jgi:hypothetical protein
MSVISNFNAPGIGECASAELANVCLNNAIPLQDNTDLDHHRSETLSGLRWLADNFKAEPTSVAE